MRQERQHPIRHMMGNVLGIALIVILLPMLIINITLIAKSYLNSDEVPSIGGYMPLIVLTDSMYPEIQSGDLIISHTVDAESVEVGDVISFRDPAGTGTSIVSHRVIAVNNDGGEISFNTQGDANNVADEKAVPAGNLVGIYKSRLPGVGKIALFMQSSTGIIVCVLIPIVLLIGYDVIRRRIYEKKQKKNTEELMRELEDLRAKL